MLKTTRRSFIQSLVAVLGTAALPLGAQAASGQATRLLAGWRQGTEASGTSDHVGVLVIDWEAGRVTLQSSVIVPSRGHGLLGLGSGAAFVACAYRYGRWVLRTDEQGRLARQIDIADESGRLAGGHLELTADGQHVVNTEIDPRTGQGWVAVRRLDTLARVAEWRTGGADPHQIVLDASGRLMVANGGVRYAADGRRDKTVGLESSLVRLDVASGRIEAQWRLEDPDLSIRHLAWNEAPDGRMLLGAALQGEHADPAKRKEAPVLAVLDGQHFGIATRSPLGEGYTGDIMAGPGGGFILSAQLSGKALLWHPADGARLQLIGQFFRAGALSGPDARGGFLIAGEKGPARWHLRDAVQMLAWPVPMSPDNHWSLLDA